MKSYFFILMLHLCLVASLFGNNGAFVLTGDSEDFTIPREKLYTFTDSLNRNFEEIRMKGDELFQDMLISYVNTPDHTKWLQIKLKSDIKNVENWYFEIPNWSVSEIDAYVEQSDGTFEKYTVGAHRKGSLRAVQHKNYLFNLPNLTTEKTVYIKMDSDLPYPMQFWVRSNDLTLHYATKEYLWLGLFYGILTALAIFNLILFTLQRKIVNLYYVIYVLASMLICTAEDGLGFQNIWPEYPFINSFLHGHIWHIYMFVLIVYLNSFLSLNKTQPKLFKLLVGVAFVCYLYLYYTVNILSENQNVGIFIPVILLLIFAAFRTRDDDSIPTGWLIMALLATLTGMTILSLRIQGYIDFGALSRLQLIMIIYAMNIAFVFDSVLFAIAIINRFKLEDIKSKKSIESSEKRFRKIFESTFDASILYCRTKGQIVDANNKACSLFDKTKAQLSEIDIVDLINLNSPEISLYKDLISKIEIEIPNELNSFETTGIASNSKLIDCEVSFSPIIHNKEKFVIINIKDVTSRKDAERKLSNQMQTIKENNFQMEQYIKSNAELESFAYVASHDIKQPLRTIKGFTNLLENFLISNNYSDKNSDQYIEFIQSSVVNLENLTTDILEHSRVSSQTDSAFEKENMNGLLKIALQNLNQLIVENNVQIQIGDMPEEVVLAKTSIIQLFQNIISNAIKFRKKEVTSVIKIKSFETAEFWNFEIEDNGIGIEKDNFDKVFKIFSKIHNASVYKGSGIGLATCKKITDLHEGQICVTSEFGIGTTFHFTISKNISLFNQDADEPYDEVYTVVK